MRFFQQDALIESLTKLTKIYEWRSIDDNDRDANDKCHNMLNSALFDLSGYRWLSGIKLTPLKIIQHFVRSNSIKLVLEGPRETDSLIYYLCDQCDILCHLSNFDELWEYIVECEVDARRNDFDEDVFSKLVYTDTDENIDDLKKAYLTVAFERGLFTPDMVRRLRAEIVDIGEENIVCLPDLEEFLDGLLTLPTKGAMSVRAMR